MRNPLEAKNPNANVNPSQAFDFGTSGLLIPNSRKVVVFLSPNINIKIKAIERTSNPILITKRKTSPRKFLRIPASNGQRGNNRW